MEEYNLVIRIFNRGRSADTVEHLLLGGTKRGLGGADLTQLMDLPVRIEPGVSRKWNIRLSTLPKEQIPRVKSGWEVVWLLCGSMRVVGAEVVPVPEDAKHGSWMLVPRRTRRSRYVPAVAAGLAAISTLPGDPRSIALALLLVGVAGALSTLLWNSIPKLWSRAFWISAAWIAITAISFWLVYNDADTARFTVAETVALMACGSIAMAFASPGFLAGVVSRWTRWRDRSSRRRRVYI